MKVAPPHAAPVGIAAAMLWTPPGRDIVTDAVAAGRVDPETAERLGYWELSTSDDRAGPQMAVLAAQKVLAEAGWSGEDLTLVVHAWLYHQGHDFWSAPHYVAHHIGARHAIPVGVQQTSNGCAAAIELAVSRMAADPDVDRCAVTTGDRFAGPGFDRWLSDFDVAYGDGATALLLHRGPGPYRLLSVASVSAPEFEIMYRGADPFSAAPRETSSTVDTRRNKTVFRESGQLPRFAAILRRAVQRVIRQALAEADLEIDDPRVRYLTLPRIGSVALRELFRPPVDELGLRHLKVLDLGRATGHLGAGDSIANLADLHTGDRMAPGEVALLLSVGNGHTWSCIAVRRE
ncbi:MAG TPA: ketoacyl-ACP synthase III family protein [Actinophytocola sp.]|uniref:ketoacyl-ACP synthase III family protein n=1 Tax=Actinophytocola sp. TaxID=1872138 RepID=UPI002DDC9007|nr:ketoacyl-ACP synthase III family protein [Actinophytocola sp.]HEV2778128.1 ketoacyl-ACP synthase III family protein [Actinophytocola sp.]